MAIKPKSRAHEDRIKALEIADGIDRELAHEIDERIEHLAHRISVLEDRSRVTDKIPQDLPRSYYIHRYIKYPSAESCGVKWWQFWR